VEAFARALGLPRPLCAVLVARGVEDPEEAKAFLRPLLTRLHPPEALVDLPRAVVRIREALAAGETILVHGDYDVDGMAGTALLTRWLRRLGGRAVPFVPHRLRHGYDLGPAGLEAAEREGATLLVTVDCGILAHDTVEEARRRGLDVIVTDHHTPGPTLPDALAVLNPAREDSDYPFRRLCGAGVAYKLCHGLARALDLEEEVLHPLLDLVGMATVADLVPLEGENRILARFGLRALARTANPGLGALMAEAGVDPESVSSGTVAFVLAPRLNALGRLGDPDVGLELLLTDNPDRAAALAREAEERNRERREMDGRTVAEAMAQLSGTFDPEEDFGVVLASDRWHPGIVGIVASRVVERIHRPAVLVALEGEVGKGSARSIPGFHLLEAVQACSDHLVRFGGHRQAAGMEIRRGELEGFREAFKREARRRLEGEDLRPTLVPELVVELEEMSPDLHRYLRYLGPHGLGNPRPVFLARNVVFSGPPRVVGKDHLKARLRQGRAELDAIGFHLARRIRPAGLGREPMDVAFHLQENEYRGRRTLQARLKDIRPAASRGEV
jgi:single-stranded-DNA-specific exonuclease